MFLEALRDCDSVRLLTIYAGQQPEPIQCRIDQHPLSRAPPYEAISYTWGDPRNREKIFFGPGPGYLTVTQNCWSMLNRLRRTAQDYVVWIDAICIDQDNISEKNSQIALMGQIYQKAARVVIYIGEQEGADRAPLKYAHSAGTDWALSFLLSKPAEKRFGFMDGFQILDSVDHLYHRPWFQRVWVLQEVYRAREAVVLCGSKEYPWAIFKPFKIWRQPYFEQEWYHPTLPFHGMIPPILEMGSHRNITFTGRGHLFELLRKTRMCRATDPRDKYFALLPMLSDATEEELAADYSKCPARVYTEVARWLLSTTGLSFLSCVVNRLGTFDPSSDCHLCYGDEPQVVGLPSWVSDWSIRDRDVFMMGLGFASPLKAAGDTRPVADVLFTPHRTQCTYEHLGEDCSHRPRTLKVRGVAFDTIHELCSRSSEERENDFLHRAQKYRSENAPYLKCLPSNREVKTRHPKSNEKRIHVPSWVNYHGLPFSWTAGDSDNDTINNFQYFTGRRSLMLTKRGYFGFAPRDSRVGDIVCVFLGGAIPFLLREVSDDLRILGTGTKPFRLVGEAYVYWLMEGEALDGVDLSQASQETAIEPLEDFYII